MRNVDTGLPGCARATVRLTVTSADRIVNRGADRGLRNTFAHTTAVARLRQAHLAGLTIRIVRTLRWTRRERTCEVGLHDRPVAQIHVAVAVKVANGSPQFVDGYAWRRPTTHVLIVGHSVTVFVAERPGGHAQRCTTTQYKNPDQSRRWGRWSHGSSFILVFLKQLRNAFTVETFTEYLPDTWG